MLPLGSLQGKSGGVTAHFNVLGHAGSASLVRNYIITGLSGKQTSAWEKKSDTVRLLPIIYQRPPKWTTGCCRLKLHSSAILNSGCWATDTNIVAQHCK